MPYDVTMPDGTVIQNVPEGTTKADLLRKYQAHANANKPKSFWQGVAEDTLHGWSRFNQVADAVSPISQVRDMALNAFGMQNPNSYVASKAKAALAKTGYQGNTAGHIVGGIVGSAPAMLIPGAGWTGAAIQGAAAGGLMSDKNDAAGLSKDMALGAAGGVGGWGAGHSFVGPLAERLMSTKLGQKAGAAAGDLASRIPGLRTLPKPPASAPLKKTEVIVQSEAAPALVKARQNLADAQRLGLPYTLADSAPQLRALGGSVSRKSPNARALAEDTFGPRALGQADRAVTAIDTHLAPLPSETIPDLRNDIIESGKPVYDPLYQKFYDGPAVTSPKIESILGTPAGQQAVGKANTIAANEFRDPKALGFAFDNQGNVVLNHAPTDMMDRLDAARVGWDVANTAYQNALRKQQAALNPSQFSGEVKQAEEALQAANMELDAAKSGMASAPRSGTVQETQGYTPQSLDYTKGGFDDMLEPSRNPITGRLVLDRNGRAINAQKNQLLSELDNLSPDYKAARQAYQGYAQKADALTTGADTLYSNNTPIRNFNAILERSQRADAALSPDAAHLAQIPQLQQGYAISMADAANHARLSANPYEAIYGSPVQQAKVGSLFPQGSQDFGRIYGLERDMAKTATETLGGSQTQPRAVADQAFDAGMGPILDIGLAGASGGKIPLIKRALQIAADARRVGVLKSKSEELAPILFGTDPGAALAYLDELAQKMAQNAARKRAYQQAGSLLALPAAVAVSQ